MSKLASIMAAVSLALLTASGAAAKPAGVADDCFSLKGHVAEACAAYIFWDAHIALQAYYKYAKSDSLLSGTKSLFAKRYKGSAPAAIRTWAGVASWPTGTNQVQGPDISILAARSSLACNRGVLVTRENWVVTRSGLAKPLYTEHNQVHTVVLRRVPGEIFVYNRRSLHAWDVFAIYKGRRDIPTC